MNSACVDLIYLDPPFNSNSNYGDPIGDAKFKDTWTLDDINVEEHGELAERNEAAYQIIKAARLTEGKGTQAYLTFMAVRLLEMERILKPTGQIFLHCDDTASGWLTQLMKAIFGRDAYRNTIIWKRSGGQNSSRKSFARNADHIIHFAMPDAVFNPVYVPYEEEYVKRYFRFDDGDGRGPYRKFAPTAPSHQPNLQFKWRGHAHPPKGYSCSPETMQKLHDDNRLVYPVKKDGSPDYDKPVKKKNYLRELNGNPLCSVWTDVEMMRGGKESTGYPTQKPLSLLERLIAAGSNEGDVVFDPFCGCATTLVAADRMGRKWVGVDLCAIAVDMVIDRIESDQGMFRDIKNPECAPARTDIRKLPDYRTHKQTLYGEQEGRGMQRLWCGSPVPIQRHVHRSQDPAVAVRKVTTRTTSSSSAWVATRPKATRPWPSGTHGRRQEHRAPWEIELRAAQVEAA